MGETPIRYDGVRTTRQPSARRLPRARQHHGELLAETFRNTATQPATGSAERSAQSLYLSLIESGISDTAATKGASVTPATVTRWEANPAFARELERASFRGRVYGR